MGINVSLETERGEKLASVGDPTNLLHRALPDPDDPQFTWAGTIDWYGDTVFNRLQAPLLRREWALLIQNAADEKTRKLLKRIDKLLQRCASEVHHYVKFYGD